MNQKALRGALQLMNHVASKFGGSLSLAEQTTDGSVIACWDIKDNTFVAARSHVDPVVALMKTTLLSQFPDVELKLEHYDPINLHDLPGQGVHKIYCRLWEVNEPGPMARIRARARR
jgi:hypothetical protein